MNKSDSMHIKATFYVVVMILTLQTDPLFGLIFAGVSLGAAWLYDRY